MARVTAKTYRSKLCVGILQCEVQVPGCLAAKIGNLADDAHIRIAVFEQFTPMIESSVQGTAAQAYILVGEHELARRHIEKAITLNPNDYIVMHMAGVVLAYLGDHEDALKWRRLASRQDPYAGVAMLEMYFDSYYMAQLYEDAIESIKGWRDPPPHMLVAIAAAYAQADHMDDAHALIEQFERTRPSRDAVEVAIAHVRMCAQPEDRDHWLEGYRKAGIEV